MELALVMQLRVVADNLEVEVEVNRYDLVVARRGLEGSRGMDRVVG
jgi:hypothetical protein